MKRLFEIDLKDYKKTDSVFRRPSARAIIIKGENTVFEQENYYYFCDVEDELVDQELDAYEQDAELILKIVDIETAIEANDIYKSDVFLMK